MLQAKMPFLKKKKQKLLSIQVSTFDADLEFSVDCNTKGKTILNLVCHAIGLRETWYFGLSYINEKQSNAWIKLDKKIADHSVSRNENGCVALKFLAKYYPEDFQSELIQEVTRHMFFLQFQHLIMSEELHCSPEASVLLASYAVQAKFGDYDPDIHRPGFLSNVRLLPQRVLDQFQSVPDQMWEDQIKSWYAEHHGLTRDEAELEYLKIVQEFEMCGVNYFKVKDSNNRDMWLGIDAKSVSIYPMANKQKSIKTYQWSELTDMSYRGSNFIIKHTQKMPVGTGTLSRRRGNWRASTTNLEVVEHSEDIFFITDDQDTNKVILDLCKGNHDLFMQRRSVNSMEIQQMKAQAREEKERKKTEQERLKRERQLRKQIEQEKGELEERLRQYQEENRAAADTLGRSEETADLLSEKAKVAEEEAMLLRMKATQAENELQRCKRETIQLQDENRNLKQNFKKLDQLAQQLTELSKTKSTEADNLRNELNATKKALLDANLQISRMSNSNLHHHSPTTSAYHQSNSSHGQLVALHNLGNQNGTSGHSPNVSGSSTTYQIPPPNMYSPKRSSNGSEISSHADRSSREFATSAASSADIQQLSQEIEKERVEYQVKSRNIEQQLLTLRSELEVLKVDDDRMLLEQNAPSSMLTHPDIMYSLGPDVQQRGQKYNEL